MPTTADRRKRRSFTTTAPTEDLPPSSKAPKHRYQSAPPRRTATMTTLLPRVSPGTRRGERKGRPDALQEGPAAPTGVAASVSDRPTGVSPDPNLHLGCSRACHQTDHHLAPPCSRSLHAVSPRHHGVRSAQQGIEAGTRGRSTVGTREGTTSTVNDGSRPDTIAGAYQARGPTGPAGNSMPVKLPPSRCSRHAVGIAAPRPSCSSSPHRRRRSHAGDRPARTQMGPGGPRSGPGTRRRPPHATTPPCCQGQHRHRAYRRRPPPGHRPAEHHRRRHQPREGDERVGTEGPAAAGSTRASGGGDLTGVGPREGEGRAAPATSRGGGAGAGTGGGGGRGGRGGPGRASRRPGGGGRGLGRRRRRRRNPSGRERGQFFITTS
ncbi:translation initiation factor IF-2 [Triticum aestivum]|uniref:translation initiation factor IF-2 n=1 Tax=Triticum aestivum TaxID=4565 RepID=UPI001D01956B|nr:translation initiation factor IF-2-like [Triticum aestivum]